MIINQRDSNMQWNLDDIRFLYPPDDFTGSFNNEKMQERHEAMQKQKIKALLDDLKSTENPLKAMRVLNPLEHIRFLLNNLAAFKAKQCLEEAFIFLYFKKNTPFAASGDFDTWKFIIENCDEDRLYAQGTPFPQGKVTVYRGSITGITRGLSWTTSQKEVAWILNRWSDKEQGGGTVYSLEVTREDIVIFIKKDVRQDVILLPEIAEKAKVTEITSL